MYQRIVVSSPSSSEAGSLPLATSSLGQLLNAFLDDLVPHAELVREASGKRKRYSTQVARSTLQAMESTRSNDSNPEVTRRNETTKKLQPSNPWFLSLAPITEASEQKAQCVRNQKRRLNKANAEVGRKLMPKLALLAKPDSRRDEQKQNPNKSAAVCPKDVKKVTIGKPPSSAKKKTRKTCKMETCVNVRPHPVRRVVKCSQSLLGSQRHALLVAGLSSRFPSTSSSSAAVGKHIQQLCHDAEQLRLQYINDAVVRRAAEANGAAPRNQTAEGEDWEVRLCRHLPVFGMCVRVVDLVQVLTQPKHIRTTKKLNRRAMHNSGSVGSDSDCNRHDDFDFRVVCDNAVIFYETAAALVASPRPPIVSVGSAPADVSHSDDNSHSNSDVVVFKAPKYFGTSSVWGTRADLLHKFMTQGSRGSLVMRADEVSECVPLFRFFEIADAWCGSLQGRVL